MRSFSERRRPDVRSVVDLPVHATNRSDLAKATIVGIRWTLFAQVAMTLIQLGYSASISRILSPQDFGIVAGVLVALRFVQYFTQLGLGAAVVQAEQLLMNQVRGAHTASLFIGGTITALVWWLAPIWATILVSSDQTVDVLRIFSLSIFFTSATIVPLGVLRRQHQYRLTSIMEIASYVLGYPVLGLLCALGGMEARSIALAATGQAAIQALLCNTISASRVGVSLGSLRNGRALMGFGGSVSVISFVEFWASNIDTYFVSKWAGAYTAGQYTRSSYVVWLPAQQVGNVMSKVMLSTFARLNDEDLGRILGRSIRFLLCVLLPVLGYAAVTSNDLIGILLGPGWDQAARLLPILAAAATLNSVSTLISVALEAKALLSLRLAVAGAQLATLVTCLAVVVVFDPFNAPLYAASWLVSEMVRAVLLLAGAVKFLFLQLSYLWKALWESTLYAAGACGVGSGLLQLGDVTNIPRPLVYCFTAVVLGLCVTFIGFKVPGTSYFELRTLLLSRRNPVVV